MMNDPLSKTLRDLIEQREELADAMREACDLLAERKYGTTASSPGDNALLTLEAALHRAEERRDAAIAKFRGAAAILALTPETTGAQLAAE